MRMLLIILWILYFIIPTDLIPDFIPGIGRVDDIIVGIILYYYSKRRQAAKGSYDSSYQQYGGSGGDAGYAGQEDKARDGSPKERKDPYKILGIDRSATPEEIKSAYRRQAIRYHPDKVSHLGEEFQSLAKKKFQDIQWAYDQLTGEGRQSRTR